MLLALYVHVLSPSQFELLYKRNRYTSYCIKLFYCIHKIRRAETMKPFLVNRWNLIREVMDYGKSCQHLFIEKCCKIFYEVSRYLFWIQQDILDIIIDGS